MFDPNHSNLRYGDCETHKALNSEIRNLPESGNRSAMGNCGI